MTPTRSGFFIATIIGYFILILDILYSSITLDFPGKIDTFLEQVICFRVVFTREKVPVEYRYFREERSLFLTYTKI